MSAKRQRSELQGTFNHRQAECSLHLAVKMSPFRWQRISNPRGLGYDFQQIGSVEALKVKPFFYASTGFTTPSPLPLEIRIQVCFKRKSCGNQPNAKRGIYIHLDSEKLNPKRRIKIIRLSTFWSFLFDASKFSSYRGYYKGKKEVFIKKTNYFQNQLWSSLK